MSTTTPARRKVRDPEGCRHAPQCDLRKLISALSDRFELVLQQIAEERAEERERLAGSIADVRNRLAPLEQREEYVTRLLNDATRALGENQKVIAAATLMLKEARHA